MPRHSKRRASVLDRATVRRIASSLSAGELPMARRNSMRERINERIDALPMGGGHMGGGGMGGKVGWEIFSPNVWIKVLQQDLHNQKQTALFRVLPGGVVPAPVQTRDEECLVLEGEVFIGEQRVGRGDLHVANPECGHGNITTRTGAMLMVRSAGPWQRKDPPSLTPQSLAG